MYSNAVIARSPKKTNALLPDTFMVESNLFIKEYLIKIILNP